MLTRPPSYDSGVRAPAWIVVLLLAVGLAGCGSDDDGEGGDGFRGTVSAGSMEPALRAGDELVAVRTEPGDLRAGDVVAYRDPGGWLGSESDDGTLVHRVIGLPGDTITCCDAQGRIAVDGKAIDEPYLAPDPGTCNAALIDLWVIRPGTAFAGECRWRVGPVPEGALFVLGDNRGHAADSRAHLCPAWEECAGGPWVPVDLVRGVVELP